MIRLGLLRHGHTAWNRAGRLQGRTDIPLDDAARETLEALRLPRDWETAHLVSSPLSRAVETGRLVAKRTPETVDALTEMGWGDWEGAQGAALKATADSGFRDIETWGWDYRPPGGESPRDVLERLRPWLTALDQDTVAICHIGIMRVLLAHASGWDFDGAAPFQVKRNRLFVLEFDGSRWHMGPTDRLREERSCV